MVKEILKEDAERRDDEEDRDEEEDEEEETESDRKTTEKANTLADHLKSMIDSQTELVQTQKAMSEIILSLNSRLSSLEKGEGSMNLKDHKGTDVDMKSGKEVKVSNTPYQTNEQAKLDADGEEASKDKVTVIGKTTETPRPAASVETVNKSYSQDFSPVLKDARELGFQDISKIAEFIRTGKYYTPSADEVGF